MSTTQRLLKKPTSLFLSILALVLFFGCSDKSSNDRAIFTTLNESLENSNKFITEETNTIMKSLEEKLVDVRTVEKAQVWLPRAEAINSISGRVIKYIDSLKSSLQNGMELKSNQRTELFIKLKEYKQQILLVDPDIRKTLGDKTIAAFSQDNTENGQPGFLAVPFNHSQVAAVLAQLSKIQNYIYIIQNKMVAFCHYECSNSFSIFYSYLPFAIQSNSYVRAGEEIEITAGVGAFSKAALPHIFINGKEIEIDDNGAAIYKFKASDKPGKHFLPLTINYIDLDGKKQIAMKNIEYTVANEPQ